MSKQVRSEQGEEVKMNTPSLTSAYADVKDGVFTTLMCCCSVLHLLHNTGGISRG